MNSIMTNNHLIETYDTEFEGVEPINAYSTVEELEFYLACLNLVFSDPGCADEHVELHLRTKESVIVLIKEATLKIHQEMVDSENSMGYPTDEWVDDGLHQGRTVEFWKKVVSYDADHFRNMPETKRADHDEEICYAVNGFSATLIVDGADRGLASALAFRDNDPEGYAKLHGGA